MYKISIRMIVTALPSISAGCKISICVIITALPIIGAGCKISVCMIVMQARDARLVFAKGMHNLCPMCQLICLVFWKFV